MSKKICLGTAMWGWSVNKNTAFQFLDMFYSNDGRHLDTAFNYPMNGVESDLLHAVKIISEWTRVNNIDDLKVIFKYGSLDNKKSPDSDLGILNTQDMFDIANEYLGSNLYSLMIHWDNRTDIHSIDETVRCLDILGRNHSFNVGLSGIKEVDCYHDILTKLKVECVDHEIKNAFNSVGHIPFNLSVLPDYRLWAYGISGSGLKLEEKDYRVDSYVKLVRSDDFHRERFSDEDKTAIKSYIESSDVVSNLYEYSMLIKELDHNFYGYIVSPSRVSQLEQIISFREKLGKTLR
ncbi:hypothetical protein A1OK_22100 [Enterovibrio norvegicus FF-454]|uniref:NADP-dependent oxidoreductase domain-containing protein n=1 Tax=Enterovibrio norvegicus FF-454 TaxID=1185651 RepID=A0A1E5C6F7_9GAMM|nr:aldo/keto reductase [Enterovibrio norvegicus]OEE61104.1 hypothetical protein A1OK_22100 [Enterovibrio norvegicus FF-454]